MTADSCSDTVRVAVLVESLAVPAWVEWTVTQIDAADPFELVAVVPAASRPRPASPHSNARLLTYALYEWADRKVFGAAPAMRATELPPILAGRTVPEQTAPLDVVVSFLPAERTAWHGPPPRHGVWTIDSVDDGRPASAPRRFWDVRGGTGAAKTALVEVAGAGRRVIAEDSARADPLSLTRTRDDAAWTSARLVLRCLRLLARDGRLEEGGAAALEPLALPSTAATMRHATRTAVRGVAAKGRKTLVRREWFVAVRPRAGGAANGRVHALPNPTRGYFGDPFSIEVDGRHYLFVEDYSYDARRAAISVSEAGSDGRWSRPRRVLERDYHLSYPFVFEQDGVIYMLPETGEAGRIELYRAVEFPDRWQLERVLVDGLTAVDATLHVEDGHHWLFANVQQGHEDRGELWLFEAASLDGEWRPHPRNPVVTDPGSARPAGRLFRRDGALIRPSQDCARDYGQAVVLNRVDVLSPSEYRETAVERIEPDWLAGLERTHTYTFDSRYEYLDGYRAVRRLRR